jgi:hypothetical protein
MLRWVLGFIALRELLSGGEDLDNVYLYKVWKRILRVLASSTRQEFLPELGKMTPIIKKLGGETAVVSTVEAIETVRQWLP